MNEIINDDWITAARRLPDGCVHTIITSPPYWGQRDYGVDGQLGLEKTFEEHIEKLVVGFREMRRILRDDGILWVNYGDKYTGGNSGGGSPDCKQRTNKGSLIEPVRVRSMPSGNLIGLAWRLALALQTDGWILRSDVVWAKAVSFNDVYSGSTMPESVNGTRWERCRVKVKSGNRGKESQRLGSTPERPQQDHNGKDFEPSAQWQDCPGCPKCEKTGGYVLRRGSWRSTRAHEYVFQFVKQIPYYADMEAVREDAQYGLCKTFRSGRYENNRASHDNSTIDYPQYGANKSIDPSAGRNIRDVWTINPQAYPEAHYATFPEALVEPCIKVSTSQKGVCPKCGKQWARVIDTKQVHHRKPGYKSRQASGQDYGGKFYDSMYNTETTTLGWRPTCDCKWYRLKKKTVIPQPVLDMVEKAGIVKT